MQPASEYCHHSTLSLLYMNMRCLSTYLGGVLFFFNLKNVLCYSMADLSFLLKFITRNFILLGTIFRSVYFSPLVLVLLQQRFAMIYQLQLKFIGLLDSCLFCRNDSKQETGYSSITAQADSSSTKQSVDSALPRCGSELTPKEWYNLCWVLF